MIEKIKNLMIKYRELIAYVIVGGLTTAVSWTCKFLWNYIFFANTMHPVGNQITILSIVTWVSGVAFAYPVSRKFVFRSDGPVLKECSGFVLSRISTLILDWVVTQVCGLLKINVVVATLISAVLVTVLNYVFSKVFVFKHKKEAAETNTEGNNDEC